MWLPFEGDPREHYPARMEWADNSTELVVQRLNRLQNTLELFLADASTGQLRTILTERDSTWVDVVNDLTWLNKRAELHLAQRARRLEPHLPRVARTASRSSCSRRAPSTCSMSFPSTTRAGWVYYLASPDNPTQRYPLADAARRQGQGGAGHAGLAHGRERVQHLARRHPRVAHLLEHQHAAHDRSRAPAHPRVGAHGGHERKAQGEARGAQARHAIEFVKVPIDSGIVLNGYVMKPADFDPAKKYPILFQVYGGPGSQTVRRFLGRCPVPVAHDADAAGIPGCERRQSRHRARAARPGGT